MSRQLTNQLTKEEQDLLDKTSEVWNDFLKLPTLHCDDVSEYRYGEQTITLADLLEQNNEAAEDVQLSDTEINFIKGLGIGQSTTLDNYNRITRIK